MLLSVRMRTPTHAQVGGYESISNLPRIQKSYREKALAAIPPAMRICATLNGEQTVQVLIPVVQGLSQKQRQLMLQFFELVGWQGLKHIGMSKLGRFRHLLNLIWYGQTSV